MKKIFIFISYMIFFFVILLITLPKTNLFYYSQTLLKEKKVYIINQTISDNLFSFDLKNFTINYNFLDLAAVKELSLSTYIFNSNILIKNIMIDSSFEKISPTKIKFIDIKHSLFDPLNISIFSKGEFGTINAKFSLKNFTFLIRLKQSDLMDLKYKNILSLMRKDKGEYIYEYKL